MFFILFLSLRNIFCLKCQNITFCVQMIISIFTKKITSTDTFTKGLFPAFNNPKNSALSTKLLLGF